MKTEVPFEDRKPFDFEDCEILPQRACPYYRKAAYGIIRCMGATITGKCGHPKMNCPIPDFAGVD